MRETIRRILDEHNSVMGSFGSQIGAIETISKKIIAACKKGKQIILFGNGGSAADAQHFAAEIVVKFEKKRRAFNAIALTTNTSSLTACGNDFGFEDIFLRQLEPLCKNGDVVIGISTSGNSPNVIKAMAYAKKKKVTVIGFTGKDGGIMKEITKNIIRAPSDITARIQECHLLAIHIICKLIDENAR